MVLNVLLAISVVAALVIAIVESALVSPLTAAFFAFHLLSLVLMSCALLVQSKTVTAKGRSYEEITAKLFTPEAQHSPAEPQRTPSDDKSLSQTKQEAPTDTLVVIN